MGINVKVAEERYNAKYVGYYDLPDREGPFYVFYTETPDRSQGHDNYFGLFVHPLKEGVYITSAASIREAVFSAIKLADGSFLVSRFRHDYQERGGAMIDGGLAGYIRYNPAHPPTHHMRIDEGVEVFTLIPEKTS
ncbi:hypothetical protein HOT99_gp251 [Caulobacter phage CcrBL10]|uniref:Uncharacterized protein n=1 Tax=Caulobacter phage CcrBL10 TaxID=2283269 RepID=A0A385E9G2_9CAUD|nr:hypothetical protein HOT99_gp251 [Caulobacter phage CcrBL10]AXQ68366.1 hypothetical protein CcrBL10_gp162c [Caulobacter phage CcrBL10]